MYCYFMDWMYVVCWPAVDPADRLATQRRLVNQRLGLDIAEAIGVDTRGIVSNDDLTGDQVENLAPLNGQGKVR